MSSNESFAAMMGECPNVTLMGDRTRGSSGNPKVVDTADGHAIQCSPLDRLPAR